MMGLRFATRFPIGDIGRFSFHAGQKTRLGMVRNRSLGTYFVRKWLRHQWIEWISRISAQMWSQMRRQMRSQMSINSCLLVIERIDHSFSHQIPTYLCREWVGKLFRDEHQYISKLPPPLLDHFISSSSHFYTPFLNRPSSSNLGTLPSRQGPNYNPVPCAPILVLGEYGYPWISWAHLWKSTHPETVY